MSNDEAIEAFQAFLRIKSESGEGTKGSYEECCVYIENFAQKVGSPTIPLILTLTLILTVRLPSQRYEYVPGKPVVVITWVGTEPSLPSLVLNSHYDVVPCFREHWNTDPYAAVRLENGDIVARGTQDMKSVCVQYLLAVQRLVTKGPLRRTVHLTYVPDEEIGGMDGMGKFVDSEAFKALNVGLVLDEGPTTCCPLHDQKSEVYPHAGLANPGKPFTVFYGERTPWWILVKAKGATGHGSRFVKAGAPAQHVKTAS